MEFIFFLFLILGPIVPFLIGRSMESAWGGLILLSLLPAVIAILGVIGYLDASNSSNSETRDWAGLYWALPIGAGIMEVLGLIAWAIGRTRRAYRD